jgi:hypothetical protein
MLHSAGVESTISRCPPGSRCCGSSTPTQGDRVFGSWVSMHRCVQSRTSPRCPQGCCASLTFAHDTPVPHGFSCAWFLPGHSNSTQKCFSKIGGAWSRQMCLIVLLCFVVVFVVVVFCLFVCGVRCLEPVPCKHVKTTYALTEVALRA